MDGTFTKLCWDEVCGNRTNTPNRNTIAKDTTNPPFVPTNRTCPVKERSSPTSGLLAEKALVLLTDHSTRRSRAASLDNLVSSVYDRSRQVKHLAIRTSRDATALTRWRSRPTVTASQSKQILTKKE